MRCRQEGHLQRDCTKVPNVWGTVGGGPVSGVLDPTPAEAHPAVTSSLPTPSLLPQSGAAILPSSEATVVELYDKGSVPVSPSPQSQSILTGLVPSAPESSLDAFASSASVLSDPDSIDSFPTQDDNDDICNVSMDVDVHDSSKILGSNGNNNGQNDNMSSRNIEQSNDNIQSSSCLDPSNDVIKSNIQSEVNISNDGNNELSHNGIVSSNKASGSGSQVAKSGVSRAKTQVSGSSSSSVLPTKAWSSLRVQTQKALSRHMSEAVAAAALSSVSRQVSSSERRALHCVFSKT